jgi:hypothetical protein
MANVGNAAAGQVLQGTGVNSGPTYESLGVNSGLTANGVVISQNNSAFTATLVGSVGDVLTSNGSGLDPSFQSPTGGLLPWTDETSSKTMSVNGGYTTNGAGLIVLTLPTVAPYGSIFRIVGKSSGGWQVAQNSGQTIHFGSVSTTTGITGSIQSIQQYDSIEILCTIENTDFTIINGPQGNITYN